MLIYFIDQSQFDSVVYLKSRITMEYFIKNVLSVTVYGHMGSLLSVSYVLQYVLGNSISILSW